MSGLRLPNPDPIQPDFVAQLGWGTRFDGVNCNMATYGMAGDVQTLGRIRPSPPQVRAAQRDQSGGTDLRDGNEALRNLNVPELELVDGPWDYVRDAIEAGRGAVIQISYAPIRAAGPGLRGSETFTGGHSIFIPPAGRRGGGAERAEYLDFDPLFDGRRPGIPKGPTWIPGQLIKRAAGEFNRGPGTVLAALTRDVIVEVPDPPPAFKLTLRERFRDVDGAGYVIAGGISDPSEHVVDLPIGTPLFLGHSGVARETAVTFVSPRVDGTTRPRSFDYHGNAAGMRQVSLSTARLFEPLADGTRVRRTVKLWAPGNAGVVREKELVL